MNNVRFLKRRSKVTRSELMTTTEKFVFDTPHVLNMISLSLRVEKLGAMT